MADEDVSWTVDGIVADGLASATPNLTRGKTVSLPLLFHDGGSAGAAYDERYRSLRDYLEYASDASVRYGTTHEGVPWFRERLPSSASVSSLVVRVEPGPDVIDAVGIWGLVVGGADSSRPVGNLRRLDLKVFVLGERSEYADRTAVVNGLGSEVV